VDLIGFFLSKSSAFWRRIVASDGLVFFIIAPLF
jgi:hypothetical protein